MFERIRELVALTSWETELFRMQTAAALIRCLQTRTALMYELRLARRRILGMTAL
jgi:hypothetical protein